MRLRPAHCRRTAGVSMASRSRTGRDSFFGDSHAFGHLVPEAKCLWRAFQLVNNWRVDLRGHLVRLLFVAALMRVSYECGRLSLVGYAADFEQALCQIQYLYW